MGRVPGCGSVFRRPFEKGPLVAFEGNVSDLVEYEAPCSWQVVWGLRFLNPQNKDNNSLAHRVIVRILSKLKQTLASLENPVRQNQGDSQTAPAGLRGGGPVPLEIINTPACFPAGTCGRLWPTPVV